MLVGPNRVALAALVGVALIGVVDHLIGEALGFAAFYVVPVLAAAYWAGGRHGFALAVVAAATWFAADLQATAPPPLWIALWNAASRLLVFCLVAFLASRWQRDRVTLADLADRLDLLHRRERELARTDALTGLPNSRAFVEALETELARADRNGEPVCVAYLDLDDFKRINDTAGHAVGDDSLRVVARAIRETIRGGDVAARLGGDEFTILLADASPEVASQVGRRLVARIRDLSPDTLPTRLSASVGIAVLHRLPRSAAQALRLADDAMYEAKATGKGRVIARVYGRLADRRPRGRRDDRPAGPPPHLATPAVASRKRDSAFG